MISSPDTFQIVYGLAALFFVNVLLIAAQQRSETVKYWISLTAAMLLSAVIGMRGAAVGLDSLAYTEFFSAGNDQIDEPIFYLIRWISSYSAECAFLIVSISTNTLFLLAFRRVHKNYPLLFAIYVCTFLFLNLNINIIRQGLAMAIFAFAATVLLDKSYKKYVCIGILAVLTHYSSIIPLTGLGLIAFYERKGRSVLLPLMIVAALFFLVDLAKLVAPFVQYSAWFERIYWYLSWDIGKTWQFRHYYYLILALLSSFFIIRGVAKIDLLRNTNSYFSCVSVVCGFVLVFLFRQEEMFADRVFYYFMFFVPVLINALTERIKPRLVPWLVLIAASNIWLVKSVYFQYEGWFIPPHKSIMSRF